MQRELIKQYFDEAITLDNLHPEWVKEAIKTSPGRTDNFIDNLTKEVEDAHTKVRNRTGKDVKQSTIQAFVYDLTIYYINGLLGELIKREEKEFDKIKREKEVSTIKECEAFLNNTEETEFHEAGVIANEEISTAREEGRIQDSIEEGFKTLRK